jgi:hypothetical protein
MPGMEITLHIPDELAHLLGTTGDIERRALEAFALAKYEGRRLTRPELRRLLGFRTGYQLDGFLKAHGVNEGMTLEEFERDRETLDRLGL